MNREWLDGFIRDASHASRRLSRTPGFTVAAIVSLGLGVALLASAIAVVNAYLVRSLPYPHVDRLYHVVYGPPGQPEPRGLTGLDWASVSDVVEATDAATATRFYLSDGGYIQEASGLLIAPGSLDILDIRVVTGRAFQREDFGANAGRVVLIGHSMWRDRFGSDPKIIGHEILANVGNQSGAPETFRIVGVLEPAFRYVRDYGRGAMDMVAPLRTPARTYLVRLREGIPVAAAERRITDTVKNLSTIPPTWPGVKLESVHERYVAEIRPVLTAVTIAVAMVLAIVVANLAVLMLLRAMRRQQEVAVRIALGAGNWRVLRMLFAESCLICFAAFGAGLTASRAALRLLAPIIEERLGRPVPGGTQALSVDLTVVLIVGGIGVLIAAFVSVIPSLAPSGRRTEILGRNTRSGSDGPGMRRIRSALIAFEVAGSLALLVGCGLMIQSVLNLVRTDLGFRTENVMRARIALPARKYPDQMALQEFYLRLGERLSALPNTEFAFANWPPFAEPPQQQVEVDGKEGGGATAGVIAVSEGYFPGLNVKLAEGRGFTSGDRLGTESIAVISETLARRLWPGANSIGRTIRTADQAVAGARLTEWRTVVGIARDVRQTFTDSQLADIYIPFYQVPTQFAPLYIHTARPGAFGLSTLRAMAAEIEPEVLVGEANSLESEANRFLAGPRFIASMLIGFAVFAGILAVLGIYGVTAYSVQQREREIAVRAALGALRTDVTRLFLKQGCAVLLAGVAGGLIGAAWLARVLASQLHGVQPYDLATMIGASILMVSSGLLAIWWPVRQATVRNSISESLKEI